jgi:alpha-tubulin suppressor-like RCC1 family protein
VSCWGSNRAGVLGNGAPGPAPEGAPALARDIDDAVAVTAGIGFACAARDGGAVECWGRNDVGQLGDGRNGARRNPAPVPGVSGAVSVVAGFEHACAVTRRGEVWCWGGGTKGQLGDGRRNNRRRATAVPGISDAVEVAVGKAHTCVRRQGGAVLCWGDNEFGQTGADVSRAVSERPVSVPNLRDAAGITAGGAHSCAVRRGGQAVCWGQNQSGQLGNGAGAAELSTSRPTPVAVSGLPDAAEIVAGQNHSCARKRTGAVVCWGNNDFGQLGSGTMSTWTTRTPVKDITGAIDLGSGVAHSCAATSSGVVRCWGDNAANQTGHAQGKLHRVPVPAAGISNVREVAPGGNHTCARRHDGRVVCWGSDEDGQLGHGGTSHEPRPVTVDLP